MKPVGYYVNCDDAVCEDCAPSGFEDADYSLWFGFEGWAVPIAIFQHHESDTPTHCVECGDLIDHALTSDGYDYVRETILSRDGVVVCQYDQGVRTGDDMVRVAILEMGWFADVQLDETEQNLLTASGWCDDPDDSEALSWLMESHENALPSGILSVWDGDCGTWSILDLRDDTLGPVLSQWNDAYPDWMV